MKRVPHSPEMFVGVIDALDEISPEAFDEQVHAYFPIEWNFTFDDDGQTYEASDGISGPPVEDPDLLYISMPLADDNIEYVYWEMRLSEVVGEMIESGKDGDGIIHDSRERYAAVRDNFLKLAAQIDAALAVSE